MKNAYIIVLSLMGLTAVRPGEAGILGLLTREHRDWNFIQDVGGMEVKLEGRQLTVTCDVSGLKTITAKPVMVNAGIGVRQLKCSRAGRTIRLSVVTSVIEKGMKSECGGFDLSAYPAGAYSVVYVDPDGTTHGLGAISLP